MKESYKPDLTEIQRLILTKLISKESMRYSEIMVLGIDVENDLFNYHLQQLVKKGLLTKEGSSYSLTTVGKKLTAHMDALGNIKDLFRVSVALVVTRDSENGLEILLQKRKRQPYFGDITSIAGKVHYGEKFEDTAKRKLIEEAGLIGSFTLLGVKRAMRYNIEKVLVEDILFHICYCNNPRGKLIGDNEFGVNYWASFDEAIKAEINNLGGSKAEVEILKAIRNNSGIEGLELFYYQEESTVKKY